MKARKPQKTLKKTRIKLYNTMALRTLLYGSENWAIKARNARTITAAETKYLGSRFTTGLSSRIFGHKSNRRKTSTI